MDRLVIKKYGDRVAVGSKRSHWRRAAGRAKAATRLETMKLLDSGRSRYVATDVAKDGMMSGPNIQLSSR